LGFCDHRVGALGWAFGLWQLARASSAKKDVTAQTKRADDAEASFAQALADKEDQKSRYEKFIAELKKEVSALEVLFNAHADADALRDRLRLLLDWQAQANPTTGGLPQKPPT
jgi:septal ring factor EnvC (AmiA/AmiB activator)